MIEFRQYAKIKDNYCLCYFGYSDEYLVQLRLLKPFLEHQFPGLNLCFGCKDDKTGLLAGVGPVLTISNIKLDRMKFAHVREIKFNGQTHPLEDLIVEVGTSIPIIADHIKSRETDRCVLMTQGNYPTKPLEQHQIDGLKALARNEGFSVDLNGSIRHASLVMGVESVQLFEAGAQGIRTILVPTGLGTKLYQYFFPKGEIWGGTCLHKKR